MARTGTFRCEDHGGSKHRDFCIECLRQEKLALLGQPYPHDKQALRNVNKQLAKCGVSRNGQWLSEPRLEPRSASRSQAA